MSHPTVERRLCEPYDCCSVCYGTPCFAAMVRHRQDRVRRPPPPIRRTPSCCAHPCHGASPRSRRREPEACRAACSRESVPHRSYARRNADRMSGRGVVVGLCRRKVDAATSSKTTLRRCVVGVRTFALSSRAGSRPTTPVTGRSSDCARPVVVKTPVGRRSFVRRSLFAIAPLLIRTAMFRATAFEVINPRLPCYR
jgi:hypothetical protein